MDRQTPAIKVIKKTNPKKKPNKVEVLTEQIDG